MIGHFSAVLLEDLLWLAQVSRGGRERVGDGASAARQRDVTDTARPPAGHRLPVHGARSRSERHGTIQPTHFGRHSQLVVAVSGCIRFDRI